jgi:hypothetical protein
VTSDLALDFSEAGMQPSADAYRPPAESNPRLARRQLSFGASEVATLLVALGRRSPDGFPRWVKDSAHPIGAGRHKGPRVFLEKAGIVGSLKPTRAATLGTEREPMLVRTWSMLVERELAGPDALGLDASSIAYVPECIPQELLPLVNRYEPALSCTPDVLLRDAFGTLGVADAKCSYEPFSDRYGGVPEQYVLQLQVQMDCCAAEFGIVFEGAGWSAEFRDRNGEPSGPVITWAVEKNDALIAELREAAAEGAERVRALREEARTA